MPGPAFQLFQWTSARQTGVKASGRSESPSCFSVGKPHLCNRNTGSGSFRNFLPGKLNGKVKKPKEWRTVTGRLSPRPFSLSTGCSTLSTFDYQAPDEKKTAHQHSCRFTALSLLPPGKEKVLR
ncbi:hypothetical protein CapIbe_007743 [Capra ibex]